MIGLDRLLKKPGVIAAGQFSEDGLAVRAIGDVTQEQMNQVAQICADLNLNMQQKAKSLDAKTNLPWGDLHGWALMAGELALLVAGDTGVFVKANEAEFNDLFIGLYYDLGDATLQIAD